MLIAILVLQCVTLLLYVVSMASNLLRARKFRKRSEAIGKQWKDWLRGSDANDKVRAAMGIGPDRGLS